MEFFTQTASIKLNVSVLLVKTIIIKQYLKLCIATITAAPLLRAVRFCRIKILKRAKKETKKRMSQDKIV